MTSMVFAASQNPPRMRTTSVDHMLVLLLALFPIVPMPIAGGVPIQVALVSTILGCVFFFRRHLVIDKTGRRFLMVGLLLLFLEAISAVYHAADRDYAYVLGRGLWLVMSLSVVLAISPWVKDGRIDLIARLLTISLLILLVAMCLESIFYPRWAVGRQLGVINIPFPRATGVPNSDGKLGTFLGICMAFYLFVRPVVPRWQQLVLQFGPWIGLAFTQSRSTLLALVALYGFYWVVQTFKGRGVFTGLIRLSGTITGLFIVGLVGAQIYGALVGEGIYQRNVDVRFEHFSYGLRQAQEGPLIGSGAAAIKEEEDLAGIHNTPIAMAVKSGIPAALVIFAIIIFPAWGVRRYGGARFYAYGTAIGVATEHMLYPGFINEFLIFAALTTQLVYVAQTKQTFKTRL